MTGSKIITDVVFPYERVEGGVSFTVNKIGALSFDRDPGPDASLFTSCIFPDTITQVGNGAFRSCENLTKISIPEGLKEIGAGAFNGCSKLTELRLPESLEIIGNGAFRSCSGLNEIRLPDGLKSIGNGAFRDCNGLSSIFIPLGLGTVDNYAFSTGREMKIYCASKEPKAGWNQYWNYYVDYTQVPNKTELDVEYGVTREQYEEIIKQNP